jgi:hypothetical protein
MNPQTLKIVVAVLGALLALGNAYLQGGLPGLVASLPTVIGAFSTGAVLIKRVEDISPKMMRQAEEDRSPGS